MKYLNLCLIAAALVACSSTAPAEPEKTFNLAGSEWGVKDKPDIFIQFQSGGTVIGHGGCNQFGGTYAQTETELIFGPMRSTKKACFGDVGQMENAFFKILSNTRAADASHLVLILQAEDGTPLMDLQRRDWD